MAFQLRPAGQCIVFRPFSTGVATSASYYAHLMNLNALAWEEMKHAPNLVGRVFKVESKMAQNGWVPFVHAMPASAKVPIAFYGTVQKTNQAFQYLRSPLDPNIKPVEEAWQEVPKEKIRRAKPNLISASYPFPCNTTPLESAAGWGCRNHFGNEQAFKIMELISSFFHEHEKAFGIAAPPSFQDRARHLILEYNRLTVGTFIVFGVPERKLSRWMYDSKPYNVPTGRSIEDVVANPELAADGNIATLVVSREVLDPDSGFVVVEANDSSEVKRFYDGIASYNPREFSEDAIVIAPPSSFEEMEEVRREAIGTKLRTLIRDWQYWKDHGKENHFVDDFVGSASDFPGYMI